jgi:SAM-dependent methyltransferase
MGLDRGFLLELIELKRAGMLDGVTRLVEVGDQQLTNCFLGANSDLDEVYALYDMPRPFLGDPRAGGILNGRDLLHPDSPSSRLFWTSLGFSYAAIEYETRPAVIGLDLNRDSVPPALRGNFDFLVNGGTTEHVANQENAFRVIHDLVAPGGLMLHIVPGGGLMTHGLFTYNLKFFWHLCRENHYTVIKLRISPIGAGPAHPDVLQSNATWAGRDNYPDLLAEIPDLSILAILRKQTDRPFATPLDLPA